MILNFQPTGDISIAENHLPPSDFKKFETHQEKGSYLSFPDASMHTKLFTLEKNKGEENTSFYTKATSVIFILNLENPLTIQLDNKEEIRISKTNTSLPVAFKT